MKKLTCNYINASEVFAALAAHEDSRLSAEETATIFSDSCENITFGDTEMSLVSLDTFFGVFDELDLFTETQVCDAHTAANAIVGPYGLINLCN